MTALDEAFSEKRRGLLDKLARVRALRISLHQQEQDLLRDLAACKEAARLFEVSLDDVGDVNGVLATRSLREFVTNALRTCNDGGMKAKEIEVAYELATGKHLHPKTIGMTLFRLKTDGAVSRAGRVWHAIQEGDSKNG